MKYYSILIPVFNELKSIRILLKSLEIYFDQGHEIILVDDGSKDGTTQILKGTNFIKLIILNQNKGKGNAIKEGLKQVTHNRILIFDGDMEIETSEISKLMILNRKDNINYALGYRFKKLNPIASNFDWGNFIFTSFFNIITNSNHKDILCCAKSFYFDSIKDYKLKSDGFDIDTELAFVLKVKNRVNIQPQVLMSYKRRDLNHGKKLQISDGWTILYRIIKLLKYY